MTSKFSTSASPLKKNSKKDNDLMGEQMFSNNQKRKQFTSNTKNSTFIPEGEKINFESEDSQGSDISYESSIQSEEDINIGQIEYFKEEMGRFFINYPELINNEIIDDSKWGSMQKFSQEDNAFKNRNSGANLAQANQATKSEQKNKRNSNSWFDANMMSNNAEGKKQVLNKNWTLIADQILNQAKQSCSFLESLSRRIALYRSKIEQDDMIDLLLKEQKNIMKQIDLEINLKKKENKGTKNNMEQIQGCDNMYFSWRKKKQMENRLSLHKDQDNIKSTIKNKIIQQQIKPNSSFHAQKYHSESKFRNGKTFSSKDKLAKDATQSFIKNKVLQPHEKPQSFFITSGGNQNNILSEMKNQKPQNTTKSLHNTNFQRSDSKFLQKNQNSASIVRTNSLGKKGKIRRLESQSMQKSMVESQQKENKINQQSSQSQTFWKHLVNFEPRTEAGRQLCQLIRKNNSPNDELGIKKTIMTFLARSKQMVQNQIVLKSTISQKIQKLYNDDSKQLLMFYPTKMSSTVSSNQQSTPLSQQLSKQQGRQRPQFHKQSIRSNLSTVSNLLINSQFRRQQQLNTSDQNQISNGNYVNGASNNMGANYTNLLPNNNFTNEVNGKMFDEGQKFIRLLQDIVEGPLMKYWMEIQEEKL